MGLQRVGQDWGTELNWIEKDMATSIGQYILVSCLEKSPPPRQRSLGADSPQGHKELDRPEDFWPVAALPQGGLSMKAVQLLGSQGPWRRQVCRDTDCLCPRRYDPIRVFLWASCSWPSEDIFGQSFFITPPVQAFRGPPCLGSFSVVWRIRHIEPPPPPPQAGVLLCRAARQALGRGTLGGVLPCRSARQAFDGRASLLFSCRC